MSSSRPPLLLLVTILVATSVMTTGVGLAVARPAAGERPQPTLGLEDRAPAAATGGGSTLGVVATIRGEFDSPPAYDAADGDVYVANGTNVSVYNGTHLVATLPAGAPLSVAFDSENSYVYVSADVPYSADEGFVEAYQGTELMGNVSTGLGPSALVDPRDGYVYVTSDNVTNPQGEDGLVTVIDGVAPIASITVGPVAIPLACDDRTGYVYIGSGGENVTILSGTATKATLLVGLVPDSAIDDETNGYLYVESLYSESLIVMSGTKVVGTVPFNATPLLGTVDSKMGYLYVLGEPEVEVVQGMSVIATVPTQGFSSEAVYDPVDDFVDVLTWEPYAPMFVVVINQTQVAGTVTLLNTSNGPTGAAYDSADDDLYVVTTFPSVLTIVGPTSSPPSGAAASGSGFPPGTVFVIAFGGVVAVLGGIAALTIRRRASPPSAR